MTDDPIARYLPLLVQGDIDTILAHFHAEPHVDDPVGGHLLGRVAVEQFLVERHAWLQQHQATLESIYVVEGRERIEMASIGFLCVPQAPVSPRVLMQRTAAEYLLHLTLDDIAIGLPIAVAGESDHRGNASGIRVYHSMWPLIGSHQIRSPILTPTENVVLPGAVADYQAALSAGDLEAMLAAYEMDGMVREPSGEPYVYRGMDQIRKIYTLMFADGGGIPLQHCTATDDGTACAIEYNCARWGGTEIPPQAGIAVYVRGKSGRLAAARIYDDVEPPAVSDSSHSQGEHSTT